MYSRALRSDKYVILISVFSCRNIEEIMAAKGEKVKRTVDDFTVSEANISKDPEEDTTAH